MTWQLFLLDFEVHTSECFTINITWQLKAAKEWLADLIFYYKNLVPTENLYTKLGHSPLSPTYNSSIHKYFLLWILSSSYMVSDSTKVQHNKPSGGHPAGQDEATHCTFLFHVNGSGNPMESLLESSIFGKTLISGVINFNSLVVYIMTNDSGS